MTLHTRQVMVMFSTAHPIMVRAIRKLDAIQQAKIHQNLNRPIDGRPAQAWLTLPDTLPEIINREVGATLCQINQPLLNELTWTCMTLTHFIKGSTNLLCNRFCLVHNIPSFYSFILFYETPRH